MEDNIEFYFKRLQENILIVEDDEENQQALDAVTVNFKAVFDYIKMFLIANKERYYGYFLMDMELQIDYFFDHEAGVNMDTMPFTLKINPLLLGKYTIKEMIFIICHEIEHIILEHPAEAKQINPTFDPWKRVALNYAMDASVNDRLLMEINKYKLRLMSCPEDGITSDFLADEYGVSLDGLKDYLYYYDKITDFETQIIENKEYEEKPLPHQRDSSNEKKRNKQFRGKSKEKVRKDSNKVIVVIGRPSYSRIITAKNRPHGLSLHKWTNMDLPDEIKEQLRQYIQQVVDGIPDEMRGLFPGYQQEALNKALEKPQVRWDQVLRKYVGTIPNGYRKTRTRLNRRQPERFEISGKISQHTIDIIVAIDTSGSMSKGLLEKVFTEIFTILKTKEFHLTVIECDAEIQTVYEAKTMSDVRLEVHGRGGTSFIPVIKYVNENRKYRKSLLIYFTDGMGDEHIPVPQVYRMLWVLPYANCGTANGFLKEDEYILSVKEPYGDVISMNVNPWTR